MVPVGLLGAEQELGTLLLSVLWVEVRSLLYVYVYSWGMGNYEDPQTILSFRVPTAHAEWVRKKAEAADMSVNKALRLWLAEAVEKNA